jgi:hypothetical protein
VLTNLVFPTKTKKIFTVDDNQKEFSAKTEVIGDDGSFF